MITMTTSLDRGPNAPENEKFSVGIPSVSPIPPNADTSSNTTTSPNSQLVSEFSTVTRTIALTYAEEVEPWRIGVVHNLGALDDANEEDRPYKPPDVERDLTAQVPSKVLADPFPTGNLLGQIWLLVFILGRCLEDTQALFLVAVVTLVSKGAKSN